MAVVDLIDRALTAGADQALDHSVALAARKQDKSAGIEDRDLHDVNRSALSPSKCPVT
ncbi:MAG: hypothetical protein J0I23_10555 [Rhizobiales bacterium]|nr:hypothetical protein [Hyphomicrobiales bacterium]